MRNATLTSLAGSMHQRGFSDEAMLAALRVENAQRCDPPLADAEVEAIAASVARYPSIAERLAKKSERRKQGHDMQLPDPEPWLESVDGAALLDEIASTFKRYLALPPHADTALALWVLYTYAFDAFYVSPIIAVTSPVMRCGKTQLLIVLRALVPRRLLTSNITPAVLFRAIEKFHPTLVIDEADTFIHDDDVLRGVLNSGHTRTTANVIRSVGDDHEPRVFSTWCAKAIALIRKLPPTLSDRAIEIRMQRRKPGERVDRLRQDQIDAACADLCRQAARWAVDHVDALRAADPAVPGQLDDRAADCWRPLLAIAAATESTWFTRAAAAALALSAHRSEGDPDVSSLLLRDIRNVFAQAGSPNEMFAETILERLFELDDRPWKTGGLKGNHSRRIRWRASSRSLE